VALNNKNDQIFKFLWQDLRYLWDSYHVLYIIDEIANQRHSEGINIVMESSTTHDIYMSLRAKDKIKFLTNLIIKK